MSVGYWTVTNLGVLRGQAECGVTVVVTGGWGVVHFLSHPWVIYIYYGLLSWVIYILWVVIP